MKVILLEDISGVGKKWEIKEVKDGYGRNYLLARNLVKIATAGVLEDAKLKRRQEVQRRAIQENLLQKSLESLKDSVITIERKANEKGHLFDGLDVREISGILEEKLKAEVPLEYIKLEKTIKEIGKHKIAIRKGDWETSFEIEIKSC